MRYLHVLASYARQVWALEPGILADMTAVLLLRARSGVVDTEARVSDTRSREVAKAEGAVAVLPVFGVLAQRMSEMDQMCSGGSSVENLSRNFRALVASDDVKAIILHIDSPGGSTFGIEEFGAQIREARGIKPIIAVIDSLGASAAYWIASAADEIVVTPGGVGGSIGVYAVHEDISAALEQAGIKPTLIKEGEFKAETNPLGPLSDAGRAQIEMMVAEAAGKFRSAVAENRGVSQKAVVEKFGDGKVFGAAEMVRRGMADKVATLQDTIERFSTPSKKQSGAARSRQAFAKGENPDIRTFEDGLGDLGLSNRLATAVAAVAFPLIAQGDPAAPSEPTEQAPSLASIIAARYS